MSEPTEDEIRDVAETMVLDAELHNAAAGLAGVIPTWFLDLATAHDTEQQRLHASDCFATADLFETHCPVLEDGYVGCEDCGDVYPCTALREVHRGGGVWDELVKRYPEGWDTETEEGQ